MEVGQVGRTGYDYPKINENLGGEFSPEYDQVAQAIARSTGTAVQAKGNWQAAENDPGAHGSRLTLPPEMNARIPQISRRRFYRYFGLLISN